jgi:uncharacterized protein YdeI (BOF family)
MKKLSFFLVFGMLFLSAALFAQTNQGANAQAQGTQARPAGAQPAANPQSFAGGGYTGTVLAPITIADLANAEPNQYVIVSGFLVQQRVPGTYILGDAADNPRVSVVVHLNPYNWANLSVDGKTAVLIYGTVSKANLSTEINADRIEVQK